MLDYRQFVIVGLIKQLDLMIKWRGSLPVLDHVRRLFSPTVLFSKTQPNFSQGENITLNNLIAV